jgi:hypothetical protein
MANAKLLPESQILRINRIKNELTELKKVAPELLKKRPTEKSWCAIEVTKHMVLGHNAYVDKIENALQRLSEGQEVIHEIKATWIPSMLIKRFPPKEGKIRFKMKTMKTFQPVMTADELLKYPTERVFDEFEATLTQLQKWIEQYRKTDVTKVRFNSAVGAMVKFNVAEACEFILCHNERHLQQIQNTIQLVN